MTPGRVGRWERAEVLYPGLWRPVEARKKRLQGRRPEEGGRHVKQAMPEALCRRPYPGGPTRPLPLAHRTPPSAADRGVLRGRTRAEALGGGL